MFVYNMHSTYRQTFLSFVYEMPTQHLGHFINCRCCILTIYLNKKPPLLIILSPFTLPSRHCLF